MLLKLVKILFSLSAILSASISFSQMPPDKYNLTFKQLATTWDEGIPLGNGMLGALIWQHDKNLRFSLDRADLWDLRPMDNLSKPEWNFEWVKQQWQNDTYKNVQDMFDAPYDNSAGPSKIPAGALEFNQEKLGEVVSVELLLDKALCEVVWQSGARLQTYVHAKLPIGWFKFSGLKDKLQPQLITPAYNLEGVAENTNPVTGQDLRRLGYQKGKITTDNQFITYTQKGWGGFEYQITVQWKQNQDVLEGSWSISSTFPNWPVLPAASSYTTKAMKVGFAAHLQQHKTWWQNFWSQSSINLPDELLAKQWYLETYKLGATTGNGAPPISLQAIWTADNGKLPPWKGDFHHDLNTQLSYWSSYSSNHLTQAEGFITWLEKNKPEFKLYTKQYFRTNGLNVPGVTTLTGQPMGGWIQYSFGPTVAAWLGHHYYLQWRYSMNRQFLSEKAYPWLKEVAIYLDEIAVKDANGRRQLPLSSSPEIFDNSRKAWFTTMTNYDLALIRWTYEKAAELANELGKQDEVAHWKKILSEWGNFDILPNEGLTFAKGFPYESSHRHFSHLMAYHPLGLIDWSDGQDAQNIISNTLKNLDKYGSDWYCGYSFSWLGNLRARAFDGDGAAKALSIFVQHFCLKNSFHANGDQSKLGFSKFTYRPFTLEGNFAFAAAIQEMLLQSHTGVIHIFPALPQSWQDISFEKLRAEGAFIVSASKANGLLKQVTIKAEKGGLLKLFNPFGEKDFVSNATYKTKDKNLIFSTKPGQIIVLKLPTIR